MYTKFFLFLFFLILISAISIGYILIWMFCAMGDMPFDRILFHVLMPLKNAPTDWMSKIYIPILGIIVTSAILWYSLRRYTKYRKTKWICFISIFCLTLIFDVYFANNHFYILDFVKSQIESSNFITKHYVDPKSIKIKFPANKRNLIILMVESLESSYQDEKDGGLFTKNHIPELTKIAKENISFSHSEKIEGAMVPPEAGWTIAGTVAQTAGIPLKLYGTTYTKNLERIVDNSMQQYKYFLPGVKTLGDILYENGYRNYFILGTVAEYAGKKNYLTQHGAYTILDKEVINRKSKDKKANINDEELFKIIKEKLPIIAKNKPFSVLIQTFDTHWGKKQKFEKVSKQVEEFYNWIKEQPYFNNTTLIIVGDHCNLQWTEFRNIETEDFRYAGNIQRKVYNAFINPVIIPQKEKYRKFSTLDMFPTILAAIGAKIDGNKLGLGTNLFSDEKTLLELYTPEYMFTELRKKSYLYNYKFMYKR
ncbi:MAG: LTA synthase family protein [Pseudomonadota bacterium]|nr:LTA synthase family protein [Pseudomonadota bacterium]